jgi:hypothetical protein
LGKSFRHRRGDQIRDWIRRRRGNRFDGRQHRRLGDDVERAFDMVSGLLVLCVVIWNRFGRQIFTVDQRRLVVRTELFGIGWSNEYHLDRVKALRVPPLDAQKRRGLPPSFGTIAFDYETRTVHYRSDLDDPETTDLVELLHERMEYFRQSSIVFR